MKKYYDRFPYVILGIGILIDIGVNFTGIYIISVTESYMGSIFAGIIAISTMCFTLITLIVSVLNNNYLGYKLDDIIRFPNSPINIQNYICISLLAIILGVLLLGANFAFDCVNSMTALILALIFLEITVAFKIWKMIINKEYVYNLVTSYFKANVNNKMSIEEFQSHTDTVVNALSKTIYRKNYVEKEKICEMLAMLATQVQVKRENDEYFDYYKYFEMKLRTLVDEYAKAFGYNDMLKIIINIYTRMSGFEYGRIELYIIPIQNMRFWSEQLLLESNYFNQIIEIDLLDVYRSNQITNEEIEKIFYEYFNSVMHNQLCTKYVRKELVTNYITELMRLQWISDVEKTPDVISLLNVLNHFILCNNKEEERNEIYQIMIEQAFYYSIPYDKEKYYDFLAFFFQSFYAFIFCEVEMLTLDYRNSLRDTFLIEFSSETIIKMSAALLLRINILEIVRAIGRRIQSNSGSLGRRFEYYSPFMKAKMIVWTPEFDIDFMFILYLVFENEIGYYNIYEDFFDWNTIDEDLKIKILREFQSHFDEKTGLLEKDFVKQCIEYKHLLRNSSDITEEIQKKLFGHISTEYKKIMMNKIQQLEQIPITIDCEDVMIQINSLMKKDSIFGWDPQLSKDSYAEFVIQNQIRRIEQQKLQIIARTIQKGVIEAIRRYIQRYANKLTLTFDIDGLNTLLEFLSTHTFDARNYTYTDDWALEILKDKPEYKNLVEKQNNIEFVSTPQIYDNLFFNKEKFCFNIEITKMEFDELDEKECDTFLESRKSYNGLYNVDGTLMLKEEAMECVKKLYRKESYSFKLLTDLENEDITYVEFKH